MQLAVSPGQQFGVGTVEFGLSLGQSGPGVVFGELTLMDIFSVVPMYRAEGVLANSVQQYQFSEADVSQIHSLYVVIVQVTPVPGP